jgi:hypothetical protein
MANLKIDWFGRSLSHRADKTSNTYAKVNSITGKTFLVTLRNPYTSDRFKDANIAQNNKMGALWMGIAAWVKAAQATGAAAEDAAQLARFVKGLRSQHRYATLRGYIAGKRYAVVNDQLTAVTIKDGQYSKTVQFEFNARPVSGQAEDDGFTESGNDGTTDGGNNGSTENPSAGGSFTITAGVGSDGGGSVTIKKNGTVVDGGSVQASASDTVVIEAVPENDNFQFMSWSDGSSQNPRTIQPSADMNLEASFMDLSKI